MLASTAVLTAGSAVLTLGIAMSSIGPATEMHRLGSICTTVGAATAAAVLLYLRISANLNKVNRPADKAFDEGYDMGYNKGYFEGRREARPVVVPMRRANEPSHSAI